MRIYSGFKKPLIYHEKRLAKRIPKPRIITDEEKELLDFVSSFIVEIILRENIGQPFDTGVETENKPK